jgi:hypothetical protein
MNANAVRQEVAARRELIHVAAPAEVAEVNGYLASDAVSAWKRPPAKLQVSCDLGRGGRI